jgi:hypothetical protein
MLDAQIAGSVLRLSAMATVILCARLRVSLHPNLSQPENEVGLALLTVAMASTIFVVTDVLYDTAWAVIVAVVDGVVFALFWFVLPTSRCVKNGS